MSAIANAPIAGTPLTTKAYKAVGVFGGPGSGKSSASYSVMVRYAAAGGRVIALDRNNQFPGFSVRPKAGFGKESLEHWLTSEIKGKFRGLLVLDDADLYLSNRASDEWKDLIVSFRHWQVDILVSSRAPQDIPIQLLRCLETAWFFRMKDPRALDKIEDWLGAEVVDAIPTEKYQYLDVDVFNDDVPMRIVQTQPLPVATAAAKKDM